MIQSIARAVDILECMKCPDKGFAIKDIAKDTSLSSSTVHRILSTLVECGYVIHDSATHTYKLGSALISLGIVATHNTKLQELSRNILKKLANLTQEDAFLMIRSGNKGIAIQKEQGSSNVKVVENFGYEIALHWGAIRKVLLAFQSDDFINDYVKTELNPTPTRLSLSTDKLIEEINDIRKNKYAVSTGDYISNGVGVAAPIFDYKGDIIASIGIIGTASRLNKNNLEGVTKTVSQCAKELSSLMGYTDNSKM